MHFASQLLVGLLVEPSVFDIDGDHAGDDLYEVHLFSGKVARLAGLHIDDADQALDGAEEDDGQSHQPDILLPVAARLRREPTVAERVAHENWRAFVRYPAAVALSQAQRIIH